MNCLFVTNHYLNENSGGVYGTKAYISAFANLFSEVDLIYPGNERPIELELPNHVKLYPVTDKRPRFYKLFHYIVLGNIHRYYNKSKLKQIIGGKKYDYAVVDRSILGDLIPILENSANKIITIHHNVEINYQKDNPFFFCDKRYSGTMVKNEYNSLIGSDYNFTVTLSDAQTFFDVYQLPDATQIDNMGSFDYRPKTAITDGKQHKTKNKIRIIITGSLDFKQNYEPIYHFLDRIMPQLNSRSKNLEILIAGRNPTTDLQEKCGKFDNVQLIPNPIDMNELIDKSDIYLCPTDMGSGIKLRVMDGLRRGLPVLCHEQSARGYESLVGFDWFQTYKSDEEFFEKLEKMITFIGNDDFKSAEIRDSYYSYFGIQAGTERIRKILSL